MPSLLTPLNKFVNLSSPSKYYEAKPLSTPPVWMAKTSAKSRKTADLKICGQNTTQADGGLRKFGDKFFEETTVLADPGAFTISPRLR